MSAILSLYSILFSDFNKNKIEKKSQLCLSLFQEESHSASVFSFRNQIGGLTMELTDLLGQGPSSWRVLRCEIYNSSWVLLIGLHIVFRDCSYALQHDFLLHQQRNCPACSEDIKGNQTQTTEKICRNKNNVQGLFSTPEA